MPLNRYTKFCYRIFGKFAEDRVTDSLKREILKANIDIRPAAYLATVWMNTLISILIGGITIGILFLLDSLIFKTNMLSILYSKNTLFLILFLTIPFGIGFMVYSFSITYPRRKAKYRGKRIDFYLPYALNFISAMSAAGAPPHEIFVSLSKQDLYGEVKKEAAKIAKDMKLLGMDVVTAIKKAIETTPSERFKEFLQGAVVTVTSGGALKPYFMAKADQYMRENRQQQKTYLETLSILAESYVTAAVAGPLLILIIIPLLMLIQGNTSQIKLLYPFIGIILPLIHIGFAVAIYSSTPEV